MLPLKDKELKVLEIVRKLGEASAKDVWKNLKEENIPYTTVSSILKKLNKLGIVEKRAVRSRGRRGVKYIYRIDKNIANKFFEAYKKITGREDFTDFAKIIDKRLIHTSWNSVAFVDRNGRIIFAYAGGKVIGDDLIGERIEDVHPPLTSKFVKQIFTELARGERNEFRRVVEVEGERFEKFYRAVRKPDGEFLGVIVITRKLEEAKEKISREIILP